MKTREKNLLKGLLSNYIQDKTALKDCIREISSKFDITLRNNQDVDIETIIVSKRGD